MAASPGPRLAWEVGFSDEVVARFASAEGGSLSPSGELALLAIQLRVAQSATVLTFERAVRERGLTLDWDGERLDAEGYSRLVELAQEMFDPGAVDRMIGWRRQFDLFLIALSSGDLDAWHRHSVFPFPASVIPASVVLAGAGSRWAQIGTVVGFLASAVTVHGAVDGMVGRMLDEDRLQTRKLAEQCRDLYTLRSVDLARAPASYRSACVSHLAAGMALLDGDDADRKRLQAALAEVLDNPDPRLKDGEWGAYSQQQFELFASTRGLEGRSNAEVIRKLAEELYERERAADRR